MPSEVRCLVVGLGAVSRQMLPALRAQPWFRLAGVVDLRPEALDVAAHEFGVPDQALFTDLGMALQEAAADAVLVNTPSELHYAHCRAALEQRKHVLVAPPITSSLQEAVALVTMARRQGVTLCVGQHLRYQRHYLALRRFLEAGTLGAIEAAWFMNSEARPHPGHLGRMDQPVLHELAGHHFNVLLALFGEPVPDWIACDGFIPSWSPYVGPCMVNAMIRFRSGLHLAYHGGLSARAPMHEFRAEGIAGVLRCRGFHMSPDAMQYEYASALGQFEPAVIDDDLPRQDPWVPLVAAWYARLQGGAEPPFSGRHELRTLALVSAAIDAVKTGTRVAVAANPRYEIAWKIPAAGAT